MASAALRPIHDLSREELLELLQEYQSKFGDIRERTCKQVVREREPHDSPERPHKKRKKAPREFDMSHCAQRHIALRICYFGQNYHGFAAQSSTDNTIEVFNHYYNPFFPFIFLLKSSSTLSIFNANYNFYFLFRNRATFLQH